MNTDYLADPRFKLGPLCKRGHDYQGTGQSLRYANGGNCRECAIAAVAERNAAKRQPDRIDAERERRKAYKQQLRQRNRDQGLNSDGTIPTTNRVPMSQLERAILNAGRYPSVATLVAREHARWVRSTPLPPEERARRDREAWRRDYQSNPDLRLYHREKAKRRKAAARGQTPVQISVAAIRSRFDLFGNCCAYCGVSGDMQIEHVMPISGGGAHDAMNIVPACQSCNYSKRADDMEEWYRSQNFFSASRLALIKQHTSEIFSRQLSIGVG